MIKARARHVVIANEEDVAEEAKRNGQVKNDLMKLNMNVIFKGLLVATLVLLWSCGSQYRLDYNMEQNALVACDINLKVKSIQISEKDQEAIYVISLDEGNKGSDIVYFDKPSDGYSCSSEYPLKFKPNTEYVISSVSFDSGLEMRVFTDDSGRIDSVINSFACMK